MSSPSFAQLGLPPHLVSSLAERGITHPFEIQAATIADTLDGRDVCGRAPTGSGKTMAFGLPLLAMAGQAAPQQPEALILAPTRELADQITSELRSVAGQVEVAAIYGGTSYGPQLKALNRGVDILVATPGRLEDLLANDALSLDAVQRVVIDEADRMSDMGFLPVVRRLLDQTRDDRQTLLFSATLDGEVGALVKRYQHDPARHEVGEETPDITAAHHIFWKVDQSDRVDATAAAIDAAWPAVVFTRTRHGADRLCKALRKKDLWVAVIHGGKSQNQRNRALEEFTSGRAHALVATDVAARGIHVDGVAAVIHYDPPEDHKTYIHRSGRTARAGESGVVVSLVQPTQRKAWNKIQRDAGLEEPYTKPDPQELREIDNEARPAAGRTHPSDVAPAAATKSTSARSGDGKPRGGRRPKNGATDGRGRGGRGNKNRRPDSNSTAGKSSDGRSSDKRSDGAKADSNDGNRRRRKPRTAPKPTGRRKPKSRTGAPSSRSHKPARRTKGRG